MKKVSEEVKKLAHSSDDNAQFMQLQKYNSVVAGLHEYATAVFLYRFFLWLIGVPIFFDFLRIRMNQRNSSSDRFL